MEPQTLAYKRDHFTISTDKSRLEFGVIHDFLANRSYWAKNIPAATEQKAIENSLCFGVYDDEKSGDQQIGFCRVLTDYAIFAYLADVFILESYRGRGLSKWLMECVLAHPDLQTLRRFMLVTRDAHGLYEQFGFTRVEHPENFMNIHRPTLYDKPQEP